MPYLTNTQRLELGLVGASDVTDEMLAAVVPEGYYIEGYSQPPAEEPVEGACEMPAKKKK